jgi:hypothetical protein
VIQTFKATLLIAMVLAGALSARQLWATSQGTTCRGFCHEKSLSCPNVLGCACVIQPGFTTGVCELIAAKRGN